MFVIMNNYKYLMFHFINTAIVAKTREPEDEQLCKAVNSNSKK